MKARNFFLFALALSSTISLHAQTAVTASGVKYTTIKPGTGVSPITGQEVFTQVDVLDKDGKTVFSTKELGTPMHTQLGKETDSEAKAYVELMAKLKKGGIYRVEMPTSIISEKNPFKNDAVGNFLVMNIELLEVTNALPSGTDVVVDVARTQGAVAAKAKFAELQKSNRRGGRGGANGPNPVPPPGNPAKQSSNPASYTFIEWDVNAAGYYLLQDKKLDEAIELFKINTELYPKSWNAYDSLGDGYLAKGDKTNAKTSFQKALQLNPKYTASKEKLDKL
ncbi:MAG: tetratricopeptide repeat protein [Saprospiraceae bacterium]